MQAAEKVHQHRSRLIEILNVPPRVRLRFRLACGLAGWSFWAACAPAKFCPAGI